MIGSHDIWSLFRRHVERRRKKKKKCFSAVFHFCPFNCGRSAFFYLAGCRCSEKGTARHSSSLSFLQVQCTLARDTAQCLEALCTEPTVQDYTNDAVAWRGVRYQWRINKRKVISVVPPFWKKNSTQAIILSHYLRKIHSLILLIAKFFLFYCTIVILFGLVS